MIGQQMKKIKAIKIKKMYLKILMGKKMKKNMFNKNLGADIIFVNVKKNAQNV